MARKLSMFLLLLLMNHIGYFCWILLLRLLVSGGFVGFGLWGSFNVILAPITSHEPESHGIKNVEKMESLN